jgi:hypothetical protein
MHHFSQRRLQLLHPFLRSALVDLHRLYLLHEIEITPEQIHKKLFCLSDPRCSVLVIFLALIRHQMQELSHQPLDLICAPFYRPITLAHATLDHATLNHATLTHAHVDS